MNLTFTKDLMINYRDEIIDYMAKERDYLKDLIKPIQLRRNKMYAESGTNEWDEINDSYEMAIFLQIFDELSDKMDLPVNELYCELEELKLSEFFEPSN